MAVCAHGGPLSDILSIASSARTALLAALVVSSALCMLSIFQSGPKRWKDWCSRCQLSSGLSEVLCQIPLPAGLQAPRILTRRRDRERVTPFMLQLYYCFAKDKLPDLCQWSFHLRNEVHRVVLWQQPSSSLLLQRLISRCSFLRISEPDPYMTHSVQIYKDSHQAGN